LYSASLIRTIFLFPWVLVVCRICWVSVLILYSFTLLSSLFNQLQWLTQEAICFVLGYFIVTNLDSLHFTFIVEHLVLGANIFNTLGHYRPFFLPNRQSKIVNSFNIVFVSLIKLYCLDRCSLISWSKTVVIGGPNSTATSIHRDIATTYLLTY